MDISWTKFFDIVGTSINTPLFHLGEQSVTLITIGLFILIVVLSFAVSKYARYMFSSHYGKKLESGIAFSIKRFMHYAILVAGVFVGFEVVGVDLTSLAFILGFLGVGIGFGLQNITSNFISGIILLIERPIAVGDLVTVDDELGIVQRINMRATEVRTVDNLDMIIPNSRFIEDNVVNWEHGNDKIRLRVPVGVAYGTDPKQVRDLLQELAENHENVLDTPEPNVLFQEFADSSLNFELRVWVNSPDFRLSVKSDLNYEIEAAFDEHDIEMPFPQRDVHLRSSEPVEIRSSEN